jgi:hypothetical protein
MMVPSALHPTNVVIQSNTMPFSVGESRAAKSHPYDLW